MVRYRNLWLFVLLAGLWGAAFVAIKAGLADVPPVLFAALRYDVAGVLMLGYALYATERWRPRTAAEWRLVGVGAVFMFAGYNAFLFVGEQWTTSAVAARALLPNERLGVVGAAGLLLGLAGVVVLVAPDPADPLGGDVGGELLVLAAAASFALGSVLARRSPADLPIETMEAWSMLGGALVMHGVSWALPGESLAAVAWTPTAVAALAYLAVVSSAFGFLVYFDLLERLGPIEINLVSYVAPVFAAATGWLLLGERVGAPAVVGFLVIVGGFALVKRSAIAAAWGRRRAGGRGQREP